MADGETLDCAPAEWLPTIEALIARGLMVRDADGALGITPAGWASMQAYDMAGGAH